MMTKEQDMKEMKQLIHIIDDIVVFNKRHEIKAIFIVMLGADSEIDGSSWDNATPELLHAHSEAVTLKAKEYAEALIKHNGAEHDGV